ncbi:flagellar hook-length control protein FliK [Desulfobulbus sp.]|uniref:flagellar hook-length control protein FliK n=1 Tax=Desulfobulbus sp. TaxID=895 RepID=UPI0027BA7752|nr:flagellar hook-length control protein FliK [Desulfobulbus sp.]
MQALSTVPVDIMTASPPAATSSTQTGQDGLFASRLKTATENRATDAKKSAPPNQEPTDAANTTSAANGEQPHAAEDLDQAEKAENTDDDAALETSLNGAAAQQPPTFRETVTTAGEFTTGENGKSASAPNNESAVARMLSALTTVGATAGAVAPTQAPAAVAPTEHTATVQAPAVTVQAPAVQENIAPQVAISPEVAAPSAGGDAATATPSANANSLSPFDGNPLLQGAAATTHLDAGQGSGQATTAAANLIAGQNSGQATAAAADLIAGQSAGQATATTPALQPDPTAQEAATPQNGPMLVQNQYGQLLAIHQTGETEEDLLASSPGKTGPTGAETKSLDLNNNYIHSRLPNEAPKNTTDQGGNQQTDNAAQNQQNELIKTAEASGVDAQATAEQLALQKGQSGAGQENQSLIFAHQRSTSQLTSSVASTESSLYRLPNGTVVPEGTVVDQMIAHFSMNKRLESGTVNLRLYPQELGELRMEIKVEQDNVKAHIIAQNPQAQEMIDRHLPRLREALEQQGLNLQQVDVTIAANDNAGGERFQENNAWRQPGRSAASKINQPVFTLDIDESAEEDLSAANTLSVLA